MTEKDSTLTIISSADDASAIKPEDASDSEDSDCDIQITVKQLDLSKMTEEEKDEYFKKYKTCAYCQSIGKDERVYRGHSKEDCKILQNTRCNWCGGYGHTGKYCDNRGEKPLDIRCMFCFRAKMDERFYMSHTPDRCRFKREYDDAKLNGRPVPPRPRGTQPARIVPKPAVVQMSNDYIDNLFSTLLAMNDEPASSGPGASVYEPSVPSVPSAPTLGDYEPSVPSAPTLGDYEPSGPTLGDYEQVSSGLSAYEPSGPIIGAYEPSGPSAYEPSAPSVYEQDPFEMLIRLKRENQIMLAKLK